MAVGASETRYFRPGLFYLTLKHEVELGCWHLGILLTKNMFEQTWTKIQTGSLIECSTGPWRNKPCQVDICAAQSEHLGEIILANKKRWKSIGCRRWVWRNEGLNWWLLVCTGPWWVLAKYCFTRVWFWCLLLNLYDVCSHKLLHKRHFSYWPVLVERHL